MSSQWKKIDATFAQGITLGQNAFIKINSQKKTRQLKKKRFRNTKQIKKKTFLIRFLFWVVE